MKRDDLMLWALALAGAVIGGWGLVERPIVALAVIGAVVIGLVVRAADSLVRLALLGVVFLLGVPLIPALQGGLSLQTQIIAAGSVGVALLVARIATRRGVSLTLAIAAGATPFVLALVAVVAGSSTVDRTGFAAATGGVLTLGILIGQSATDEERGRIVNGLTLIAILTAAIAIVEWRLQAPVYSFTEFQSSENPLVTFRASSVFGHPLILTTFMSSVVVANLARGRVTVGPFWVRNRLLSIGVPVAGALVSQSRSILLIGGLCVLALLYVRQEERRVSKTVAFMGAVAGSAAIAYSLSAGIGGLAQRLGTLSLAEQSVRSSSWTVANEITNEIENLIGAGPRAVAAEVALGTGSVSFGTLDNQFLTAFTDFGLIGAVGLLLLIGLVFRALRRRSVSPDALPFVLAAVAVTGSMLTLDPLAWPPLALLFALGVGAATTGERRPTPTADARRPAGFSFAG